MATPMKLLSGFRLIAVRRGDSLRAIALRELGDANLWRDLVAINDLTPPYIVDDPAQAAPGVIVAGGQLRVPSATSFISAIDDPERVFGVDLALVKGRLEANGLDLVLVSGADNLRQALGNRLDTPTGDLVFHPDYGCRVHELKGQKNTAMAATLGAAYVKDALSDDERIAEVSDATVQVIGDAMPIAATARAVSGTSIDIQTTG